MKILIHKTDHLGDFALALPALWELRQAFGQDTEIHLLVRGPNVEWQKLLPWLGNLHSVVHPRYERYPQVPKFTLSLKALRQVARLRRRGFDWGVDLISTRNDLLGKWLLWTAGCNKTSGPDGAHSWMLHRANTEPDAHQVRLLASRFPAEWNLTGTTPPTEFMPGSLQWKADPSSRRPMVLAPFAGTPAKRWLDASWQELFKRFQQDGPVKILVPQPDLERHREFLALYPADSLQVVKTIEETLLTLVEARGCVVLDTAVAHYAWLTGTPFVQLFARTAESKRWAPPSGGTVLQSHPDLTPSVSEQVLPGYAMDDISVEQVLQAWKLRKESL